MTESTTPASHRAQCQRGEIIRVVGGVLHTTQFMYMRSTRVNSRIYSLMVYYYITVYALHQKLCCPDSVRDICRVPSAATAVRPGTPPAPPVSWPPAGGWGLASCCVYGNSVMADFCGAPISGTGKRWKTANIGPAIRSSHHKERKDCPGYAWRLPSSSPFPRVGLGVPSRGRAAKFSTWYPKTIMTELLTTRACCSVLLVC